MTTEREDLRQHLVAAHHWPAITRATVTYSQLVNVHTAMHNLDRIDEAVAMIRAVLGMPDDDDSSEA